MQTKQKGDIAETKACEYLTSLGFEIIEKNFYAKKLGEIDIIALKENTYHFVEVKSGEGFEPIYNLTPSKLRHIIKSAQYYLKLKGLDEAYCIDVITVQNDEIELLENITF